MSQEIQMKNLTRTSPESIGISSETLSRLMERLKKLDSLNSIMIMRDGLVCLEGWWKPYQPDQPHMLFSLSKSFTSVAIGMIAQEKHFKISDPLIVFFPEYSDCITDERMRDVTLHHLLSMGSGHGQCAKGVMEIDPEHNYIRGFFASELTYAPGERFVYNSGATYMLAALIKKLSGQNVREYLMPRLFEPLGIVPGIWESDLNGINFGGWGLYLKTEDIAKFADLLLNGGRHDGKQLIPSGYLAEATRKQIDNSMNDSPDWKQGYGYQFWRSQHGFRGDGASGQYAVVIPEKKLAIAITSCIGNMQDILTALWEDLLPGLEEKSLPENPAARRKLLDILSGLSMETAAGKSLRKVVNRFFEFETNPSGIYSCSVETCENECALTFNTRRGMEQLRAGFGSHRSSVLQLTDHLPHPVAASAAWIDDDVLEIHSFCLDGTFRDVYRIDLRDSLHPLTRTSRCSTFRPLLPDLLQKGKDI